MNVCNFTHPRMIMYDDLQSIEELDVHIVARLSHSFCFSRNVEAGVYRRTEQSKAQRSAGRHLW